MDIFITILSLFWGVLSIILFFKIWIATNDIAEMKAMMHSFSNHSAGAPSAPPCSYQQKSKKEDPAEPARIETLNLHLGDKIIRLKDNKEYKIEEIRPNGILIYLGMIEGYRTLTPDQFRVISKEA